MEQVCGCKTIVCKCGVKEWISYNGDERFKKSLYSQYSTYNKSNHNNFQSYVKDKMNQYEEIYWMLQSV